jgi:hypothetical protein
MIQSPRAVEFRKCDFGVPGGPVEDMLQVPAGRRLTDGRGSGCGLPRVYRSPEPISNSTRDGDTSNNRRPPPNAPHHPTRDRGPALGEILFGELEPGQIVIIDVEGFDPADTTRAATDKARFTFRSEPKPAVSACPTPSPPGWARGKRVGRLTQTARSTAVRGPGVHDRHDVAIAGVQGERPLDQRSWPEEAGPWRSPPCPSVVAATHDVIAAPLLVITRVRRVGPRRRARCVGSYAEG